MPTSIVDLYNFLMAHPGALLGAYWVASAAISALPMPDDKSGTFYKWLFVFAHTLAGSIARALATKTGTKSNGNGGNGGNGNGWKTDN